MSSAACMGTSSQTIHQRGLVPRARPSTYDGQPINGRVRLEGYAETTITKPEPSINPDNGGVIARHQFGGAVRFSRNSRTDLGFTFDAARSEGAVAAGQGEVTPPRKSTTFGVGVAIRRAVPMSPEWNLGLSGSLMTWTVNLREDTGVAEDSAQAAELSFSAVPSYRTGSVVLFGGLTLATEVYVPESYVKTTTNGDSEDSKDPASASVGVAILSAGARVDVSQGAWLSLRLAHSMGSQGDEVPMVDAALGVDIQ